MLRTIFGVLAISTCVLASAQFRSQPFSEVIKSRGTTDPDKLVVDLGYGIYRGSANQTTGIDSWLGIRFGASTAGSSRWQAPQVPEVNRSNMTLADTYGFQCPQSPDGVAQPYSSGITGNEDCLFVNVFAPSNATRLPVLVYIHGGGYGANNGRVDMSPIIQGNQYSFMVVTIQYRLGAFGFLSSREVSQKGVLNAGLLDQILALQWVQAYIDLFGGDPTRVTISGESAGGGSVMLMCMAYGGTLGDSLFQNSVAASPYLPTQYNYDDDLPTYQYNNFVALSGCSNASSSFECLVSAPSEVLQNATFYASSSALYGQWAFLPVTDGTLLQDIPSRQLQSRKLNGQRMLSGNNALEGLDFVPANITNQPDLISWLELTFPSFADSDIQAVLNMYPSPDVAVNANTPLFATDGTGPATAFNESSLASGQQQRAYDIYGEVTFVCPSYWLAEAYSATNSSSQVNGSSTNSTEVHSFQGGFKYQYSVIPSLHSQDERAYFLSTSDPPHSADFSLAFKAIWGNFITTGNPSISSLLANGLSTGNQTSNPISSWPIFGALNQSSNDTSSSSSSSIVYHPMINLNESFTNTITEPPVYPGGPSVVYPDGPGILNQISLVNGWTWEANRGARCEFWRQMSNDIPAGRQIQRTHGSSDGDNDDNGRSWKIGVGVGVGIGVPVVLGLIALVLIRSRKRAETRRTHDKETEETVIGEEEREEIMK